MTVYMISYWLIPFQPDMRKVFFQSDYTRSFGFTKILFFTYVTSKQINHIWGSALYIDWCSEGFKVISLMNVFIFFELLQMVQFWNSQGFERLWSTLPV